MQLTAANTAIVVDSTADFPEAPERYPNWRIVPLYVRFGQESFRDYVELGPSDFYARLRGSRVTPTTSQPTPGDFQATYEELGIAQAELVEAGLLHNPTLGAEVRFPKHVRLPVWHATPS